MNWSLFDSQRYSVRKGDELRAFRAKVRRCPCLSVVRTDDAGFGERIVLVKNSGPADSWHPLAEYCRQHGIGKSGAIC